MANISKIFVIFFPMILGLFLYLLFRPTSIYIFEFIRVINLEDQLLHLREYIKPLENYMPLWIVYSLPTMLWAFSLTCLICVIWSKDFTNIFFLIYLLTAIAIIIGSDQLAYVNNQVLGKTGSFEASVEQLKLLRNKEHKLLTSFCIYNICRLTRAEKYL